MKRFYKLSVMIFLNTLLLLGLLFVQRRDLRAQVSTPRPSPTQIPLTPSITPTPSMTPDYSYVRDTFPIGPVCADAYVAPGPSWRGFKIGEATLDEVEAQYGESVPVPELDRQEIRGEYYTIIFCVKDDIITAIHVGSDLVYMKDYVAIYGEPDAVTYSQPASRVLFWFEAGIAIDVYINTYNPDLYGLVNLIIYFPYQEVQGYETRWPYKYTQATGVSAQDKYVSEEQNPFDFDAIIATITAEPSRTPTPTYLPVTPMATATSDNG